MSSNHTNPPQASEQGRSSVARKIAWSFVTIGVVATLVTAVVAYVLSSRSLESAAFAQLRSNRAVLQDSIESYLNNARSDLASLADSLTVKAALRDLSQARANLKTELAAGGATVDEPTLLKIRADVRGYYESVLLANLKQVRAGDPGTAEGYQHKDDEANLLQYFYTVANSAAVGSKFENTTSADIAKYGGVPAPLRAAFAKTAYARNHDVYHPILTEHRARYGYYDIFICDPEGYVVYTNFKELDFNGNLKFGPEKDTDLGKAFAAGLKGKRGEVSITDIAPYPKSYDAPAIFVSTPIVDGAGKTEGVYVYQLPIDRINQVMTFKGRQQDIGLGQSGEAYLVGPDFKQRTDSRFLADVPATSKKRVLSSDGKTFSETSMGVLAVNTEGTTRALAGTEGVSIYPDYRGVPVLGSYSKLNLAGLNWGVIVEQDAAEAFAPARRLAWLVGGIGLGLIVVTGFGGFRFARNLSRPIVALDETMAKIAAGDENARAPILSNDEIGQLATTLNNMVSERNAVKNKLADENKRLQANIQDLLVVVSDASDGKLGVRAKVTEGSLGNVADALNLMLENVGELIGNAKTASNKVAAAAAEITTVAVELENGEQRQSQEITVTSDGVKDLNGQAQRVLQNCQSATQAAENARRTAEQGAKAVRELIQGMEKIRENTQANSKKIKRLGDRSMEIAGIVKVIGDISAKTDMLALNASIEAARAGEQGRGFTVVAEQVRGLADRTKTLTSQIEKLVNDIQQETSEAVAQMETQTQEVEAGTRAAQSAGTTLESIVTGSVQSSELVSQINQAASQQASRTKEMLVTVDNINRVVAEAQVSVRKTSTTSEQLAGLSSELNKRLSQFEVGTVAP